MRDSHFGNVAALLRIDAVAIGGVGQIGVGRGDARARYLEGPFLIAVDDEKDFHAGRCGGG